MLLWIPWAAVTAQSRRVQTPPQRLDSLLLDQATHILERYGDTFYILGLYLGSGDEVLGIATRHWPALSAHPDEWRDSLVAAFGDYLPQVRAAAYLEDRWRLLDSTRAESTYAVQPRIWREPSTKPR